MNEVNIAKQYKRPIVVGIALATFGELFIFVVFGLILYPQGDILSKFLWTVVFCGIGMGATFGALIDLFVVNRLQGNSAIFVCMAISTLVLGLGCNLLCFNLDQHFHYFGGQSDPHLFILNGISMSILGGLLSGWLLFTGPGAKTLDRIGI